jgi:hypothetical protein
VRLKYKEISSCQGRTLERRRQLEVEEKSRGLAFHMRLERERSIIAYIIICYNMLSE